MVEYKKQIKCSQCYNLFSVNKRVSVRQYHKLLCPECAECNAQSQSTKSCVINSPKFYPSLADTLLLEGVE